MEAKSKAGSSSRVGETQASPAADQNSQPTEAALREYQAILATAEEVAQIGSWKWDLRTQKVTWSDEMFRLFGLERESFDGDVNRIIAERIHPQDAAAVAESNRMVLEEAKPVPLSYRIVLPDGTERTVWAQGKLIRDEEGQPIALTGFVQDISERVRAEKQIIQLKRLYATLSQVNQMIVHVRERNELFQTICDVAVQFGEFPFAWVGLLNDETGDVLPAAANGADLNQWPFPIVNIHKGKYQNTLTPTAIRTAKVAISRNVQQDERTQVFGDSLQIFNFRAVATIPFSLRGKVIGVVGLVSYDRDLFNDEEEVRLLEEMGLDISFALDNLENEKERRLAENKLRENEERLRLSLLAANQGLYDLNVQTGETIVNRQYAEMLGYDFETFVETNAFWIERLHPDDKEITAKAYSDYISGSLPEYRVEFRQRTKDGNWKWILSLGKVIEYDAQGNPLRMLGTHTDITERKQAEEKLQRSQEIYKQLFENNPHPMWVYDAETLAFLMVNDSAMNHYGYSRDEFLGMTIKDIRPPEEIPALMHDLAHERKTLEKSTGWKHRKKDGTLIDVEITSHAIQFEDRTARLVLANDITERKKVEEALKRNEHVLRLFVEHSPASIAMFDREMKYIVASRRYLIDYRLPIQDIAGHSHYEIFPEIPERWKEIHRRCLAGAIEKAEEDPFPREDGTLDWVRWEIRPWYEGPEKIGGIILFSEVITERKKTEEAVRNRNRMLLTLHKVALQVGSELRLPHLLANVLGEAQSLLNADRGGGVYLYEPDVQLLRLAHGTGINRDRDGITVQIGEGVAGRVYQTAQPLVIDDYTHWEGRSTVLIEKPPSTVMGVPLFVESKVIGVLTFIANSKFRKFIALDVQQAEMFAAQVAIAIQNAQLYRKAQDEIAERTKAQDELHLLNAQLEQRVIERTAELQHANRAKDEFLANMSHELRTPLNTVLGLSESLLEQRKGPLNERQAQALGMISTSGHHLLGLINDILEVTKIEAGKLQLSISPVSVKELCESSLNFVKELALKKSIHIEYINAEFIATLQADPQRLKQILINLLVNAVKFTPERGSVHLDVSVNREQEQILFSVTDTGIGIAPEDMKKLFTPFTQLDSSLSRQYAGTGLGLALVQKLTDLHGGSVEVESEPGTGSRFTIRLPWKTDEEDRNKMSAANGNRLSADLPRTAEKTPEHEVILLAEDNAANIITISDYLEAQGYKVAIAYDGLEAVERAKDLLPDIILMDIQMPNLNGLEAMALLRTDLRLATTPIIALTALAMPGDRERCLSAGADEYMSKPVSLKGLLQTIQRLLAASKK